jgi:hypothetical protein
MRRYATTPCTDATGGSGEDEQVYDQRCADADADTAKQAPGEPDREPGHDQGADHEDGRQGVLTSRAVTRPRRRWVRPAASVDLRPGPGPADVFASSGGAVNALPLVARHPNRCERLLLTNRLSLRPYPDAFAASLHRVLDTDA